MTSYLQFSFGIGNMFGFMEGSLFFDIGGFTMPFYVNACGLLIILPFIIKYLPTNKQITEYQNIDNSSNSLLDESS